MTDSFSLHIFADVAAFNRGAAQLITTLAQEAVAENGRCSIALSGGSTPGGVYQLLGERPLVDSMPWSGTHLFWGDERLVPPQDSGSNYGQVARLLLEKAPVPPGNVHRARGELGMSQAVTDYVNQLRQVGRNGAPPVFDLVLLGLGSDGHTASLFPGSPVRQEAWVVGVTADYDGRPAQRLTFTPTLINRARHVIFLVTGSSKAAVLEKVLYGPHQPKHLPVQRIQPAAGTVTWLTDQAAAQALSQLR